MVQTGGRVVVLVRYGGVRCFCHVLLSLLRRGHYEEKRQSKTVGGRLLIRLMGGRLRERRFEGPPVYGVHANGPRYGDHRQAEDGVRLPDEQ